MPLIAAGISFRTAPVEVRERAAPEELGERVAARLR
jgi:glutamyl-tRNA reductase